VLKVSQFCYIHTGALRYMYIMDFNVSGDHLLALVALSQCGTRFDVGTARLSFTINPYLGSGLSNAWRAANFSISMESGVWRIFEFRRAIASKRTRQTVLAKTAFGSMINGEFALRGGLARPMMWKSWTIPEETMAKTTKLLDLIHPGEILSEDFMKPLGVSINRLSRDLGVPPNRVHGVVHGTRSITADTALRLGTYFEVAPETWLNLQTEYDLRMTRREHGEEIAKTVRKRNAA
jgi:addiction module HigA family antidote